MIEVWDVKVGKIIHTDLQCGLQFIVSGCINSIYHKNMPITMIIGVLLDPLFYIQFKT